MALTEFVVDSRMPLTVERTLTPKINLLPKGRIRRIFEAFRSVLTNIRRQLPDVMIACVNYSFFIVFSPVYLVLYLRDKRKQSEEFPPWQFQHPAFTDDRNFWNLAFLGSRKYPILAVLSNIHPRLGGLSMFVGVELPGAEARKMIRTAYVPNAGSVHSIHKQWDSERLWELKEWLKAGANPDATVWRRRAGGDWQPDSNVSLLMAAVLHEDIKAIRLLIEYGADVNYEAENYETALSLAQKCREPAAKTMVRLLRSAGATHVSE
jgi:hypothetical protein